MPYDPRVHHRRSIRLRGYDYAQPGLYCVTIVVQGRRTIFGEIVEGAMRANDVGRIVEEVWGELPAHFACADTDAFVLMPNHVHAIVVICEPDERSNRVGAGLAVGGGEGGETPPSLRAAALAVGASEGGETPPLPVFFGRPTLGQVVAYFKYRSAKRINALRGTPGEPLWQRNYYEHVVRDERDLQRLRRYIEENPVRWDLDDENPTRKRGWPH